MSNTDMTPMITLRGVYWIEILNDYFDRKNLEDFKDFVGLY